MAIAEQINYEHEPQIALPTPHLESVPAPSDQLELTALKGVLRHLGQEKAVELTDFNQDHFKSYKEDETPEVLYRNSGYIQGILECLNVEKVHNYDALRLPVGFFDTDGVFHDNMLISHIEPSAGPKRSATQQKYIAHFVQADTYGPDAKTLEIPIDYIFSLEYSQLRQLQFPIDITSDQ